MGVRVWLTWLIGGMRLDVVVVDVMVTFEVLVADGTVIGVVAVWTGVIEIGLVVILELEVMLLALNIMGAIVVVVVDAIIVLFIVFEALDRETLGDNPTLGCSVKLFATAKVELIQVVWFQVNPSAHLIPWLLCEQLIPLK